jgi:hypothetical protein
LFGFLSLGEVIEPCCLKGRTSMEKEHERFYATELHLVRVGVGVGGAGWEEIFLLWKAIEIHSLLTV